MAADPSETRELDTAERALIDRARAKAFTLYEGVRVRHRSCGIAVAETFGLATPAYQSLRKGGITGAGHCGSIKAGELVLGELLGDPDPAGAVTPALRRAVEWYQRKVPERIDRQGSPDYVCNNLTAPRGDFMGPERKGFCTNLTAEVAALVCEAAIRFAGPPTIPDLPET